jgi:hypothetical protein
MKFILLTAALTIGLVIIVMLTSNKKGAVARKMESSPVKLNVRDFPEHGISLVGPSDPSFADIKNRLPKTKAASIGDSYSVFLKNTGSRAVVGYRIKWECVGVGGDVSSWDVSNVVGWIFLHGEESDRRMALNRSTDVIKPNSTWLISPNTPAQPLQGGDDEASSQETNSDNGVAEAVKGCASVTVIADGIFFDDGTFIGPDTTDFFTEVKSQVDARYEILRGVQSDLVAGKNAGEIFKGLEMIRDREEVTLGEHPTSDEFRTYFRNIFARNVLGSKEIWGAEKAIEEVQVQLSRPWVRLRKL